MYCRTQIRWAVAATLTIGWVLWMTLRPDQTPNTTNLIPLHEPARAVRCLLSNCPTAASAVRFLFVSVLGNMAVFFPIGLSLAGVLGGMPRRYRLWVVIALGATLSTSIELIQLGIPTRATDVDDVLFNTIGAALGAVLLGVIQRSRLDGRTTNDQ